MKPKIAAIVQARTGSTRYPGKVFRPLAGIPMIEHIIKRLQQVSVFDSIVLAVPDAPSEDGLVSLARRMGIDSVKGPEEDVLQRFIMAGDSVGAEHILRVCGDSPLIAPELMISLVHHHLGKHADITISEDEIPRGTGAEMVCFASLKHIAGKAEKKPYREHVTAYFYDHTDQYAIIHVPPPSYLKGREFRLTVDTDKDFQVMDKIYSLFYTPPIVDLKQAILYLETHPEIANLNADVIQKDWRLEK